MHDLDDADRDPYPPPWHAARVPAPARGPVIEAYVDTDALEVDCDNCRVAAGEFCTNPENGELRKMPCNSRITKAANTTTGAPHA
ncbi:hypothetical protein A9W98_18015 [Mycobacterium gordonae]|uniref:DNA-binding phage zinc finger domain-containing protein n=1 Tax=Mycobacterium gordonae TaxID=1778 RepID=A0A1A6BI25_MYCGO|nr:hypothetical protein [Mycobacterium gordonae]OBS01879.1 hypothetical protein A9W98_18015 [Mycobacterium gordonae]